MMSARFVSFLSELYGSRSVLQQLIAQQLILRYRRTLLGYLWTLINPLLMITAMALVFSSLFKADLKTFVIFLLTGMIPWNFFSSVVTQCSTAFISNEGLIKKIYLPKVIFPLSVAFVFLIDSLLALAALLILIPLVGGSLSWSLLFLPVSFVLLFLFSMGLGLIMAIVTVYFRDLQYVIMIVTQGLFYLTPILYKSDALTGKVTWLVKLNPVTPFIALFRVPTIDGTVPGITILVWAASIAVATMAAGLFVFLRHEKNIVFRL